MKRKGGPGNMMAQMQELQQQLMKTQEELAEETVEASAGGGAVRVIMTGTQECRQVVIAESLLDDGDVEMLQDLVLLAVNQAIHDSQALAARRLGPLTGGMGMFGGGG
ncbi:MAG: YbaB/EbfC family nucleoid-associated protein [Anaerolineales bacterium]|nr:YbaB/EbfC family nucleoid-associated protein [Anaerolineales bacterium]